MKIAGREIGPEHEPYVIAEISGNHQGSIDNCMKLMREAKRAGASAIKLQAYTADTITMDGHGDEFVVKDGPWAGRTLYDLYKEAETPFEWFKPLMDFGRLLQIHVFASVFDSSSIDLLEILGCPAYKIASFEITDLPLIQEVAKTQKPCIISTGMASHQEILDAMNTYRRFSLFPDELALLHCVSAYPTLPDQANLPALGPLSSLLSGSHQIGLSDHTLGYGVASAAVAFGASIIEKHICLDRSMGGPDASFSLEPHEFALMAKSVKEAWQAIKPSKSAAQDANRAYRKSLYVVKPLSAGDVLSTENVRAIRPANGLPPSFYASVLGQRVNQAVAAGTPLRLSHFSTEEQ